MKTLVSVLGRTWVWSLLLVIGITLSIWFVGPLLAVAEHIVWAAASARLATIAVLFLAWGLAMVFVAWREAHGRQRIRESDEGRERQRLDIARRAAEQKIRQRFDAAVRTLRHSGLYRRLGRRQRRELPWYLVLGPHQSGKTSLLQRSGLEFPLDTPKRPVQDEQACQWYFAEQGVIIDGSGQYLSPSEPDHEWSMLLELLRKRRRARPLNGILLVLPVEHLKEGESTRFDFAQRLRARLLDAKRHLHADIPVYLVLSKADTLPGFDAFFDGLSGEASDQVLGATFSAEQDGTTPEVLRNAFDDLMQRLHDQVIERMHQERDASRRADILDFPHQLGQLRSALASLIEHAFSGDHYRGGIRLRGFYLTSARTGHRQAPIAGPAQVSLEQPAHMPSGVGRSRFIRHLFSKVIFPEAELAGMNRREARRVRGWQRIVFASAIVGLGLCGWLWGTSFIRNHERLDHLAQFERQWQKQRGAVSIEDDARESLPALESALAASNVFPSGRDIPWLERGGLYQGDDTNPVVREAYERELESQLLPRIARTLETRVKTDLNQRERLLTSLRAYLMLALPERRDNAFLRDWLATEWSSAYPGEIETQDGLLGHLDRLLERRFVHGLDEPLVAQARQALRQEPLASVVYRELRDRARHLPEYRLGRHLGPQDSLLVGTDRVIPGFYTRAGYQRYFLVQNLPLAQEILRDNWVMGDSEKLSGKDFALLLTEIRQHYWRDYADHWSEAIGQVRLQPLTDPGQGADGLAGLVSASSPLLHLLQQITDNTRIADAPETVPVAGKVLENAAKTIAATGLGVQPDSARQALQRRFDPLHRLLDDEAAPTADLAPMMRALNELQMQLAALARASQPQQAAFELAAARMGGQLDAMARLRNSATRLPQPLGGWFAQLADESWTMTLRDAHAHLNQRYRTEVHGFYAKAIQQRYPFDARSESEVAIADFREFFKVQGVLERFFDTHMRPFVSGDPGSLRPRNVDGRGLPLSAAFLAQIGHAQAIRRGFFAEQPGEPRVRFRLEPYSIDSGLARADFEFGGRQLAYRHGPIVPMAFDWPADSEGRSSLILEELGGRRVGIEENRGAWSLFRLLDRMRSEHHNARDALMFNADLEGLRASYLLLTQRSPNPFDLRALRSFRLPESL